MDGAGAQLDLLEGAVDEQLTAVDRLLQGGVEAEDAVDAQHVGDEVVGESGESLRAAQPRDPEAIDVGGGDLGALEEGDGPAVICGDVGERFPAGEKVG